jgi:hypothetical protein
MTFDEAEVKFRELQARIQRGEAISEDAYQTELAKLMVQDERGVFWSLEPGTGRWLQYDGTNWVPGTPPRPKPILSELPPLPAPPEEIAATESAFKAVVEPARVAALQPTEEIAAPTLPPTQEMAVPQTLAAMPPSKPEPIPTYERSSETRAPYTPPQHGPAPGGPATGGPGLPARPLRGGVYSGGGGGGLGERAWVPFAITAVILAAIGLVLWFVIKPQFVPAPTPTPRPTATERPATPTELPTFTPAPTNTPAFTATPLPVTGQVTENTVNIRALPSTKAGILGKLKKDDRLTLLARSEDGAWYQIALPSDPNKRGWVFGETLQISGDPNTLPVEKTAPVPTPRPPAPTATRVQPPAPTNTPAPAVTGTPIP